MIDVLPVILDQSDPIIIDMLKRIQEHPEDAAQICKEVALKHRPLAAQLEVYVRHMLDKHEATLIAEEVVDPDKTRSIGYKRVRRELTINGVTHIIPRATDAPKKELLLALLCEDYAGLGKGVAKGRYLQAVQAESQECSDRMMETARVGLNTEIKTAFGISNFIRSRGTSSVIPRVIG